MSGVFDDTACMLGEGPLWHPGLGQLFWFDILANRLYTRTDEGQRHWQFAEHVSAAGWVDDHTLLIASETALFKFDLATGKRQDLVALEAENLITRSNDGRTDPWGGFWIGTMGKATEPGAGAIYRYYRGELRRLFAPITISNSICFTPDRRFAHYSDTDVGRVMRVALDAEGWPDGEPQIFLDLAAQGLNPDGAVVDSNGTLWLALWGMGRVAAYSPDGTLLQTFDFDAPNTTCPAFGGPDRRTLFCTSARSTLTEAQLAATPASGKTFVVTTETTGQSEHQVIL